MTLVLKDPGAQLDYLVDWGADYLADDTVAGSVWDVSPREEDGVVVTASTFDDTSATVTVAGGKEGHRYRLSNRVSTTSGRTDERSILLRVEQR
ncbi:phage fiber-tail adaptor protein [Sphingomicrobium aestuariivivum]|uniref:phage fiber-tail adaptor protein n=1 Tax=Sphingomicrobium aestuariivivum TaxID=1582356 RepID=UPI001FD6BE6A|nr:hypothetical protein [Sphingomicrobium aestuariivivum]MCJ8191772.1 hypothetical protein [Sphingomicrobium aestuariivivum]